MTTNSTFVATTNRHTNGSGLLEILIHTDGVELTDRLREAVNTKIGRVRQYAPRALRARVQLHKLLTGRSRHQFRAHVLYELPGKRHPIVPLAAIWSARDQDKCPAQTTAAHCPSRPAKERTSRILPGHHSCLTKHDQ